MSSSNPLLKSIADQFFNLHVCSLFTVSGYCLLIYDWLLTFPDEVNYMWNGRLTTVRALYFFNRYTAPLMLAIDVYDKGTLARNLTAAFCQQWMVAEGSWTILVMGSIHWLVVLRIWSLYERSRIMLLILTFVFLIYFIATAAIWAISVNFMKASFTPSSLNICVGTIAPWLWTIWIPSLLLETFLFVLLFIKSIQHYRKKVNTPVLSVLYFDGFLYFLVISSCSLFNLFVWLLAPPSLIYLAKYWTSAICNIAGYRLVLDLRNVHYQYSQGTENFEMLRTTPGETWKTMGSFGNTNMTVTDSRMDLDDFDSPQDQTESRWAKSSDYHTWETNYPQAI